MSSINERHDQKWFYMGYFSHGECVMIAEQNVFEGVYIVINIILRSASWFIVVYC